MDLVVLIPVAGIIGGTWMFVAALGYVRERQRLQAAATTGNGMRENAELARENADLRDTVGRLEDRIAVLERIATDPGERTAREIEALR